MSAPALEGARTSTFEGSGEGGAVAVLRRFGVRAVLGMLVATGLLALGSFTQNAAAQPMCDVPDPPPICGGGEQAELLRLTATSQHGTVAINQGGSAETRRAWSGQPIYLRGAITGVSPARSAKVRVTETWYCGWYATGSQGTLPTTASRTYTVPDPETRCPSEGLYQEVVTAVAVDPINGLSTGELTIYIYGYQWPDDRMPIFGPW